MGIKVTLDVGCFDSHESFEEFLGDLGFDRNESDDVINDIEIEIEAATAYRVSGDARMRTYNQKPEYYERRMRNVDLTTNHPDKEEE